MVLSSSYGKQFINKYRKKNSDFQMSNNIVEAILLLLPNHQVVLLIKNRKQARQLAYDVRYKVKSKFKEGQKFDPASLKVPIRNNLIITCTRSVKQMAKKMLIGEEYDFVDVDKDISKFVGRIFKSIIRKIRMEIQFLMKMNNRRGIKR